MKVFTVNETGQKFRHNLGDRFVEDSESTAHGQARQQSLIELTIEEQRQFGQLRNLWNKQQLADMNKIVMYISLSRKMHGF